MEWFIVRMTITNCIHQNVIAVRSPLDMYDYPNLLAKRNVIKLFEVHFVLYFVLWIINRVDSWPLERNGIRIAVFVAKYAIRYFAKITTILRTTRHTADWIGLRISHQNVTIVSVPLVRYLREQQSTRLDGNIIRFALSV